MSLNKILTWFYKNYNNYVLKMKESDHNFNNELLNPYHIEGDVWTHTLMVLKEANKLTNDIEVLLSALLHDIGKPDSKEIVNEKCRFFNHENISSFLSIDILKKYNEDFPEDKINIVTILLLINWHSDFGHIVLESNNELSHKDKIFLNNKYYDLNFYKKMLDLNEADTYGRISLDMDLDKMKIKFNVLRNYIPQKSETKEIIKNKTSKLIVFTALPASGKTTIINRDYKDYEIISSDDYIEDVTDNKAYRKANLNDMYQNLQQSFKNKKNVVIDRTNLTKKSRRRYLNSSRNDVYYKEIKVFLVGQEQLNKNKEKRYKETGKLIPFFAVKDMVQSFNYPGYDEKVDYIDYIIY